MSAVREWFVRLGGLISSKQNDDELDAELESHLSMHVEDNLRAGMSLEEARRDARLKFGSIESTKELYRRQRGIPWIETIFRNVRFGLRILAKSPAFSAIAILTLALGIGANTAIFSVVHGTLLAPMEYPDPDKLMVVWSANLTRNFSHNVVSAADYLAWKEQNDVFQDLSAYTPNIYNLSASDTPEQVRVEMVTANRFSKTFGVGPWLGRDFLPEEDQPGKDHEVILTQRFWEERFGSNRNVVGQQIRMNGEPYTIVGVLPKMFDRRVAQVFTPLAFKPEQINRDFHWIFVLGRLKPGVTVAQAQANMNIIAQRIAADYPKTNRNWGVSVEPYHNDFIAKETRKILWLLLCAVGFVLLIACANIANLLLARGIARRTEVAVRASLGASPAQLFAQFLTESLLLASIGGAVGAALGWALMKAIMATMPRILPPEADVHLSLPVLLFTFLATFLSGLFFGCVPAWYAAHSNLNESLKEGGRTAAGSGRHTMRRALIVVEASLAMTLLAGAGLAIHSLWNFTQIDTGFEKARVVTFSLPIPTNRFSQTGEMTAYYDQLLEKIKALPGVQQASVSTGMPLRGPGLGLPFTIAGKPFPDGSARPTAAFQMVTPAYLDTFGIRRIAGRVFNDQDVAGGLRVAMVSENFVKRFLPAVDPLTQRVVVPQITPGSPQLGPPVEWQIVGVFHNVRYGGTGNREDVAEIDVPFAQSPERRAMIGIKTAGDPNSVIKSVASVVKGIEPDLPMAEVKTMDQVFDESIASDRFEVGLMASFAGLALLLAAVGIYGAMALEVERRSHEVGLRIALGASHGRILSLILKEGMLTAAAGLAVGLVGAWIVERAMRSLLWGTGGIDLGAFTAVSGVLLASALLACYVPARRAMRVDPIVALRHE